MTWLVPMDLLGFLVSCDTSIFTLALKLSCYNLRKIDCVNVLKKLVVLTRYEGINFDSPRFYDIQNLR